jgi:hypothetical protein
VKQSRDLAAATLQPGAPTDAPALIEIPEESEFVLAKMEVLGYHIQYSIFGCGPRCVGAPDVNQALTEFLDHQLRERQHPGQVWARRSADLGSAKLGAHFQKSARQK